MGAPTPGAGTISSIDGVVGFERGYVALDGHAGRVWYSADGRSWQHVPLPIDLPLEDATDGTGQLGRAIATNGHELIVVGGYSHEPCKVPTGDTGGGPDCAISPITWVSDDGVAWRSATPQDMAGELVAAWPVAGGGWNAALSDWSGASLGGNTLWQSADGISWGPLTPNPPAHWEGYKHAPLGVASGSDEYLLAAGTTVAAMTGGGSWRVLDGFPGSWGVEVVAGVGPASGWTRWVLGGQTQCDGDACDGPTIWSSADGIDWTTTALPVGPAVIAEEADHSVTVRSVTSLALSGRGYVAVGVNETFLTEGARHETWVSDDGVSWQRLTSADRPLFDYGPGLVADGPAGVIGISGSANRHESVVWQLR